MKQMNYKVSICIPVYNTKQELLEDCLDSIPHCGFDNRKDDIEIIVIDDGSTELDVHSVVMDFNKKYPDYHIDDYKHLKNEGLFEARRSAVFVAKGKYIYNLDSDDFLEPDGLGILIDKIYDKDYDIVQSEYVDLVHDPKLQHIPIMKIDDKLVDDKQSMLRYYAVNNFIPGYVWGKLIKRDLYLKSFNELPYLNLTFCEDFLQIFFLCKNAKSICSFPDIITYNYNRLTGMTNISNSSMTKERFKKYLSYSEIIKIINENNANTPELKQWIREKHTTMLLQIYSSIILSVKDEDLKEYLDMFSKAFGKQTLYKIHELFESMRK